MTPFHATHKSDPNTNNQIPKGKGPQPPFSKGGDERDFPNKSPCDEAKSLNLKSRYSPVLCDGVTIEVPPLKKGVRGIF